MSATESNLSSTGFDYVVAVTQDSVNATLVEYLYYSNLQPVNLCYCYSSFDTSELVQQDYDTFVQTWKVSPLEIPAGTPLTDARIQTLVNAKFAFAIQAILGLPPGVKSYPPIITLIPGQQIVTYTMTFSNFNVCYLQRGSSNPTWLYQSQPNGTPWTFSGQVNLHLKGTDFTNLPTAIQNLLNGLGGPNTFSIQQLYYDLNSAALEQNFETNLPATDPLYGFMTNDFVNIYWKSLGANEVLGYGANQDPSSIPPSSLGLAVTSMTFSVSDVNRTGDPVMLNYLCNTNNNTPPTSIAGFDWDWMDQDEASNYHGVAALSRNTFVAYLENALQPYLKASCYEPLLDVYKWTVGMETGTIPTPTSSGPQLLQYSYASPRCKSKGHGDIVESEISLTFTLTVNVKNSTQMVIEQHLVIWCQAKTLGSPTSANVVDKTITDTYSFSADNGNLSVAGPASATVDNSQPLNASKASKFFTLDFSEQFAQFVKNCAQQFFGTDLTDIPAAALQNFVFPGGATFVYAGVQFSDYQDLVAYITYQTPSS